MATDFLIRRDNLRETKFVSAELPTSLDGGQLLLKIDQFAFTANNVTYAAAGDMMKYWDFFPAPDGWGKLPVWGFADVVESAHLDIEVGERIYGYFPLASHLVIDADHVRPHSFVDAAKHRQHLSKIYNQYTRTANTPGFPPAFDHMNALFRPLFMTSFLIDDFLFDNDFFGAEAVIISSASSKTAFGTAYQLHMQKAERGSDVQIVGLTSQGNVEFVEGLGWYDQVVAYGDLEGAISAETKSAYVDISGNGDLRSRVHHHFTDNLKYSTAVGMTNWENPPMGMQLPGPKAAFFFAPSQAQKRLKEWGAADFQQRIAVAMTAFAGEVQGSITINVQQGNEAILDVYSTMLEGNAQPSTAYILSF